MTSKRLSTDPAHTLALLQEQEATANKRLAETQADIAKGKAYVDALKKHHFEHRDITNKVQWFARENNVSFEEMMAQYAWNRLLVMKKELITLRRKKMSA